MVLGKHFINDIESPVEQALKCLLELNPNLGLIESHKVIYNRAANPDKVVLISGGGSGHEPAHAGFVGNGMLDVAVAGDIFASPSAAQILVGLKAIESSKGTLMIVKNYTGDKLNFGLAAQKARSQGQQISVVFVNEDASLNGSSLVGRRGLAGTVFVHKIAGAAAAKGWSLEEVTRVAQKVADNVATVGVSLDRCSVPGRKGEVGLAEGEVEYGMGIHNEPGVQRSPLPPLSKTISTTLSYLLSSTSPLPNLPPQTPLAILINNLGGLSILELNVISSALLTALRSSPYNFTHILRKYTGTFMTSLDGPGFSITILKLDDEILSLLDSPTEVQSWPKPLPQSTSPISSQITPSPPSPPKEEQTPLPHLPISPQTLTRITNSLHLKIQHLEPTITTYDTLLGDGDCGTTLLKGVTAIHTPQQEINTTDLSTTFSSISHIVEETMGGTSGALYGIFLNAFVNNLRSSPPSDGDIKAIFQKSLKGALDELCTFTLARKGHRTLMDTLIPFVETFSDTGDLKAAVEEARKGCESTKKMEAKLGRASYVNTELVEKDGGVVDPGALGLLGILEVLGEELA
ncbi:hypothetical protein TWF730_009749 [Orbilia blumenaviensis]|uniref:Dihydroxyacetone kinase n=1 Tax=Orbilia blumenaviensis TaxID=1796055 RepID=A0AAV9UVX4_9PEZI